MVIRGIEGESAALERPLCRAGSKTPNPCWREATEKQFPEDGGPTLCPEHARLVRTSEEKDAWWLAL